MRVNMVDGEVPRTLEEVRKEEIQDGQQTLSAFTSSF
jgi:hypothetical protein